MNNLVPFGFIHEADIADAHDRHAKLQSRLSMEKNPEERNSFNIPSQMVVVRSSVEKAVSQRRKVAKKSRSVSCKLYPRVVDAPLVRSLGIYLLPGGLKAALQILPLKLRTCSVWY